MSKLISIVVPAYNEEKRIYKTLRSIAEFSLSRKYVFEIIVVFDGRDRTPSEVKRLAVDMKLGKKIRLLEFKARLGKGGALQKGFAAASGDVVFLIDADSSTPPWEIPKLLGALDDCDIAIGSRYLRESKITLPFRRVAAARVFNLLVRLLFFLPYNDTQCGFKAFRKSAVRRLLPLVKTKDFVWDVDVLVNAGKLGLRVKELPIEWHYCEGGTITLLNGLQTGMRMFRSLLKLRFSR